MISSVRQTICATIVRASAVGTHKLLNQFIENDIA